jgi:hypothetical protein
MAQFMVIVKRIKIGLFKCGDIYVIDSPFLFNRWQMPAHLQNDSDLRAISSEIASDLGWCGPITLAFLFVKTDRFYYLIWTDNFSLLIRKD